ncbi:hypothetical protein DYB38_009984 [Aphanomyces astaci]|uniref:RRM domain-containing protein n=1 Tax=Aphanomyces astaci TaxID=112090 RepID=A0A397CMX7_APHAT|nr:hypothetical protein DYB38_009984 [Aphanomyces astaci]
MQSVLHHSLFSTWDHKREKPPQPPRTSSIYRKDAGNSSTITPLVHPPHSSSTSVLHHDASTANDGESTNAVPLLEEALHPFHSVHTDMNYDVESNALRMGFPHYKNEYVEEPGDEIREELREEATLMAERVLCRIRRTMGERETNKVLRKLSSYTTNPRPTRYSVAKFFGSLEIMMQADHADEYTYLRAFLCGKDSEKAAMDTASLLHPDHPLYHDLCAVILVHCKRACSTTLARVPNSTLPFVKRQMLRLLQAKGWDAMVSYAGLLHVPRDRNDSCLKPDDNEWIALTLEDDLAEFDRDLDDAKALLANVRRHGDLSHHDVEKLLSVMVAYVKMAKAHRDILHLLVCEFQNTCHVVAPTTTTSNTSSSSTNHRRHTNNHETHDTWVASVVEYLSSGRVHLPNIQAAEGFAADLVHHRHRSDAAIRLLLDARMRTSHIYIRGLDEEVLDRTMANKSDAMRRALLTTALNLATVLDDREFHAFYGRYVRHKLTWRSNFDSSVEIFLGDVADGLPKQIPEAARRLLVDSLGRVHNDLTLEALNVCRLRVLNRGRLIRTTATLTRTSVKPDDNESVDAPPSPLPDLPSSWDRRRTVFYHNLPPKITVETVRHTFQNIGPIVRLWMFDEPRAELAPVEPPPATDATTDAAAAADDTPTGKKPKKKRVSRKANKEPDQPTRDVDAGKEAEKTAAKMQHVVASERHSTSQCVVEFESESAQQRALHPALKIFGVMVNGAEEVRATFSTAPDVRNVVTIHSIPFCTQIHDVHRHIQAALGDDLIITLGGSALPDLFVTKGTLELAFNSFEEAAVVVDRLTAYLDSRPDPKHELPFVGKAKQKYQPTTTKVFVTNPLTKTLRANREKEKADDLQRNTTPTVYLKYDEGVDPDAHRPFEVAWTPVPRRRSRHIS